MRKLVEYRIISGRTVEVRRSWMDVGKARKASKRRAKRVAGASSLRKIAANEREAVRRLARIINTNFAAGDLWLQLKYDDERLPADKDAAKADAKKFLRKVARDYKKRTGKTLKRVLVTSDTDPRTGKKVRLHHHLVMDRLAWEEVVRYWPEDQMYYKLLDGRGDYTGIAKYMVENNPVQPHEQRWSCSRGMEKPIVTEPEVVEDLEIEAPKGCDVRENVRVMDSETGVETAYLRAVMPDRPTVKRKRVKWPDGGGGRG